MIAEDQENNVFLDIYMRFVLGLLFLIDVSHEKRVTNKKQNIK